jgi:hypothetical protein
MIDIMGLAWQEQFDLQFHSAGDEEALCCSKLHLELAKTRRHYGLTQDTLGITLALACLFYCPMIVAVACWYGQESCIASMGMGMVWIPPARHAVRLHHGEPESIPPGSHHGRQAGIAPLSHIHDDDPERSEGELDDAPPDPQKDGRIVVSHLVEGRDFNVVASEEERRSEWIAVVSRAGLPRETIVRTLRENQNKAPTGFQLFPKPAEKLSRWEKSLRKLNLQEIA